MRGLIAAAVIALAPCGDRAHSQEPAGPNPALTPGDFLDNVGKQAKARWRQLYRAAPPAAPSERLRVAFMLGALACHREAGTVIVRLTCHRRQCQPNRHLERSRRRQACPLRNIARNRDIRPGQCQTVGPQCTGNAAHII